MDKPQLRLILSAPRGFCAGVERAVEIVERSLKKFGAPVYVRHEIVHNKYVLESLRAKGAIFVADLDEVPVDAPVIFSAHGVPKSVPAEATRRNMTFIDATCPLVSKVHLEAEAHHRKGRHILLIGHAGHPEVIGTLGQLPEGAITLVENAAQAETVKVSGDLAYITQTTLSVDDAREIISILQRRFPHIEAPKKDDICYATTNRQAAVRAVAGRVETMIVIGSKNSSNANRLVEAAHTAGCKHAFLADNANEIDWASLQHIRTLGLAAGASTPERLVDETIETAKKHFDVVIETVSVAEEDIVFKLPRALVA